MRLLVSARDAAAAHHLQALLQALPDAAAIDIRHVASEPALSIWRAAGLSVEAVTHRPDKLLATAQTLIDHHQPDVLLVGLSGPDAGLDEALIAKAGDIPSYALQDYWGDINPGFGRYADCYLVRDSLAARLTRERAAVKTLVIGPQTASKPPASWKQQTQAQRLRRKLRIAPHQPLMLFCSQPLWQSPAYPATLISSLQQLPDGILLVRPHPRETAQEQRKLRRLLQQHCKQPWYWDNGHYEQSLMAADLVLSAFSSCAQDKAQLDSVRGGRGQSVFLLHQAELKSLFQQWTQLAAPPPAQLGIATSTTTTGSLQQTFSKALAGYSRLQRAKACKQLNEDATRQTTLAQLLMAGRTR